MSQQGADLSRQFAPVAAVFVFLVALGVWLSMRSLAPAPAPMADGSTADAMRLGLADQDVVGVEAGSIDQAPQTIQESAEQDRETEADGRADSRADRESVATPSDDGRGADVAELEIAESGTAETTAAADASANRLVESSIAEPEAVVGQQTEPTDSQSSLVAPGPAAASGRQMRDMDVVASMNRDAATEAGSPATSQAAADPVRSTIDEPDAMPSGRASPDSVAIGETTSQAVTAAKRPADPAAPRHADSASRTTTAAASAQDPVAERPNGGAPTPGELSQVEEDSPGATPPSNVTGMAAVEDGRTGDPGAAPAPSAVEIAAVDPSTTAANVALPERSGAPSADAQSAALQSGPPTMAPVVRQRPVAVPAGAVAPTFDIVHVSPEGAAVIAGRAEPGAQVSIMERDQVIGSVVADNRGEWVFTPAEPIQAGERELGLVARTASGQVLESLELVVMMVPGLDERIRPASLAGPAESALAMLVPRELDAGRIRLLQRPSPDIGILAEEGLSLDLINYDTVGQIDFAGRALPGSTIYAYVDGRLIGTATVADDSTWRLVPSDAIVPGLYTLKIEQIDKDGGVLSSLETPFTMADLENPAVGDGLVIVQPGNSLWRISRRVYGRGVRYSVIYDANLDQIVDPNLIYPGQIFVIPKG